MDVNQRAIFFNNPHLVHKRAVRRIAKYLASTSTYVDLPDDNRRLSARRIAYKNNKERCNRCYIYADFYGGWDQADANNAENFMSRMGYVIMYAGCPVLWCSKLLTETDLSTTEAEYTALSQAMHDIIPFMALMKEVLFTFDIHLPNPEVFCKVSEDNQSCIAVAESIFFIDNKTHHY